ncbi:unnamed protein product [Adineta ricciae]|uniref:Potassium channel tetramerisation-type BTB domain-containing protein n=1 Tax=Adineta ricciae TaxID=249248 RepID=A0A815WTF3_ADIRI|nr:unnamed protein product [Adineta ricciae]
MNMYKSFLFYFLIFLLHDDRCIKCNSTELTTSVNDVSTVVADETNAFEKESTNSTNDLDVEKTIMERFLKNSDVIQFNVGGEIMYTTRASLLHAPDSTLTNMLLNKSKENISIDKESNVFLDFNPKLFRHALEQLRLFEENGKIVFYPPPTPILTIQFNAMLTKLGLEPAPISDDDIFTFNVGDEIFATRRRTLNRVPNSKLSKFLLTNKPSDLDQHGKPFLDYDPKLFRHLLSQIQVGQVANFEAPSIESKIAFDAMLHNLGLQS